MDMNRAVDDLVWLSTRLTGIIALKDVLTDYHTLQNQVNDFKTMVSDLKSRWNELNTSIKDQQREITSRENRLNELTIEAEEAEQRTAKAKAELEAIKSKFN